MRPITIAITVCVLISCQRNQDSPPDTFPCTDLGVRNAHAMAYHQAQEKIYLFGGATHDSVQSDLWTFDLDSARWQKFLNYYQGQLQELKSHYQPDLWWLFSSRS